MKLGRISDVNIRGQLGGGPSDANGHNMEFNPDQRDKGKANRTPSPSYANIESLLAEADSAKYVVVRLGDNQAAMEEVAQGIREILRSDQLSRSLKEATSLLPHPLPEDYAKRFRVIVAADTVQTIQAVKEMEYHKVAGIVVHPAEINDGDHLLRILNVVDEHRVIDLSQKKSYLSENGQVNMEALFDEIESILRHHYNVMQEVISHYAPRGEVLESGLLPPAKVRRNDGTLEEIIQTREGLKDAWAARRNAESTNTKKIIKAVMPGRQTKQVAKEDVQKAAQVLSATDYPALSGENYAAPVSADPDDPNALSDPRRLSRELGELVEVILSVMGAERTPGTTYFYRYATKGNIGLFDESLQATPEQKFIFVKPYNTAAEVQALFNQFLFNQFDLQKDRGISVLHEPLAYYYSKTLEQFAVISRSPLLAITAEVANRVRELGPEFFDVYLDSIMELGLEHLIKYKGTAASFDAKQRALILHGYKAKAITAKDDLQIATGTDLTGDELRLFLGSIGTIFDDMSLWNPKLFGPIMDYKPYNNGNRLGVIKPSAQQVREALFDGATTQPDKEVVRRTIRETYGILEHERRPAVTLEDSSHMINSPELQIEPAKRVQFFASYLNALMPDASSNELSGVWPAYFGTESMKAIRKMQRTVHYMIMNFINAPRDDIDGNQEHYTRDYRNYAQWLARTAYAATILTSQHSGDKFEEQLKVLSQLYSERNPRMPSNPKALGDLPRAFYGTFVSLQRLIEADPKPNLLQRLDVLR